MLHGLGDRQLAVQDLAGTALLQAAAGVEAEAGIGAIIWATGYTTDYRWLKVNAFDDAQRPQHHRGVSTEPGVYFLGLPWLSRRGSTFIWGVWHDAKYIADQIAIQRQYQRYQPS